MRLCRVGVCWVGNSGDGAVLAVGISLGLFWSFCFGTWARGACLRSSVKRWKRMLESMGSVFSGRFGFNGRHVLGDGEGTWPQHIGGVSVEIMIVIRPFKGSNWLALSWCLCVVLIYTRHMLVTNESIQEVTASETFSIWT